LGEIHTLLETLDGNVVAAEERSDASKKDSKVSFVEYCRFMRFKLGGRKPPSIKGALHKLFLHYDRDKNGELDAVEVKKLLRSLSLSEIDAQTLISSADRDGDGKLSFDEIYKFIKHGSQSTGLAYEAWKVLKIWLQLSSGWDLTPKDPSEVAKLQADHPNDKIVTFIRHGQSEGNYACDIRGSAKGVFNPYLTPKGVDQAKARGEQLKGTEFDLVVVSPMRRTLQTFWECIGHSLDPSVPVIGHPLAREQFSDSDDVGDPPKEIKVLWPRIDWSLFPDSPEVWWYPGPEFKPEEIPSLTCRQQRSSNLKDEWEEPWSDLMARASDFEKWLIARPEKRICVFSHGGFIESLVGPRMDNAQSCVLRVHAK
jgi:broad specificity phosphatase PhoE/Ca2+-binding EF-hand superfamily protein